MKNMIPQENSYGVIFPGESKNISYLLEIHNHFPELPEEKKEMTEYLKIQKAVIEGEREYLSRIFVNYDYLDNKGQWNYRTLIDQKIPKTGFRANESFRLDGYSFIWVVSFDSN
ncbi:hypothetical protein KJ763_02945 [Patescibacteria group bacterium]|nr:hypothetical protein [Patescibacteria group bacterium]